MREGLLYDLLGRYTDEDARERTVRSMQERYHVDLGAGRARRGHRGRFPRAGRRGLAARGPAIELILRWAARLHEIGLDVAHSGYHRHGAYLLANADMAGFPARRAEAAGASWSAATGASRRSRRRTSSPPPWDKRAPAMTLLLRLAVLLHRGRSTVALPAIKLAARARFAGNALPAGLARRSPADRRRPAARDRNLKSRRLPAARFHARNRRSRHGTMTGALPAAYRASSAPCASRAGSSPRSQRV